MNKKLQQLVATAFALLLPAIALAQSIDTMACHIESVILDLGYVLVVIAWIVTGILYLISVGNSESFKKANIALFAAIVGTIVVLLASQAASFVGSSFGLSGGATGC